VTAGFDLPKRVGARGLAAAGTVSSGSLVLALALPLLFLHSQFQPSVSVNAGSTSVDAYLSDFAVLAVVVAAFAALVRRGAAPLRPGRPLWIAGGAFFLWLAFETLWGGHVASSYPTATHAVTAAKFLEYALLAPAVALLVRSVRDLLPLLWSLALWSAAATIVGIAEFFGADIAAKGTVGHRQASFLSSADFAALSGAALLVGIVAVSVPRFRLPRALGLTATAAGALGMIVAGAVASVLGLGTALVAGAVVLLLRRELDLRRVVASAAVAAIVVAGAVAIRGADLQAFARFLGASTTSTKPEAKVQTYAHRTLLVWLGFEIWKDHPVLGVGWEGSAEPANFAPHLPAAHRHFPEESPLAFPSEANRYGVQNVWVQALADLGVVGFALWLAVFLAAAWLAARAAIARGSLAALLGLLWTALLLWLWSAQGFIAGIPLDALTWLAFGLAATRSAPE
jgi:O-antigen ligase